MQLSPWLPALAVVALLLAAHRLRRRRYRSGLLWLLCAGIFATGGVVQYQVGRHLQTYAPVHYERDIAEIRVQVNETGHMIQVRDLVAGHNYRWESRGRQWRLELRVLSLSGLCTLFDWRDHYRLASLQVHSPPEDDGKPVIFSVQLQQAQKGWDLWRGIRRLLKKRPDLADEIEACVQAGAMMSELQPLPENGVFRASIREPGLHIRAYQD